MLCLTALSNPRPHLCYVQGFVITILPSPIISTTWNFFFIVVLLMTNCNLILLSVIVLPGSDIRLGLKDFESTKPPKLEVIQISMRPYLGRCKLQSKGHGITCGEITHSCSQKKSEMLKIQLNLCITYSWNYSCRLNKSHFTITLVVLVNPSLYF